MQKKIMILTLVILAGVSSLGQAAYHHQGEADSPNFVTAYPQTEGTKLDSCALCHSGGQYEKKPGQFVTVGSCQWCHMTYGYDGSGDIEQTINPFGRDYRNAGRSANAFASIENTDSDEDGYNNKTEINALTYPGDAGDDPTKIQAPRVTYSLEELEDLPVHRQFLLMNTSRSGDFYAEYQGVTLLDLLRDAGMIEETTTAVTVYAPDGYSYTYELKPGGDYYYIDGTYPQAPYYYDPQADVANGGWCDYSAPSCTGRNNGDTITVDKGLQLIFAYKRDGAYLEAGYLDAENRLQGEGPFRTVPPQMVPSPPDQSSTAENQGVIWPYTNEWDHNAGFSARTVVAIRIEPIPEGTTDFNWNEGGWDYVDNGEVIVYGNLASGGVQGTVTTQVTNQPIAQATITTDTGGYSTITDDTGSFSIKGMKTGTYSLRVSAAGYQSITNTVTITKDGTATIDFQLTKSSEVCPAGLILPNGQKELALLRSYRDKILLQSDFGKQYVKSYYEHAAEMVKILLTNNSIREKCITVFKAIQPSLENIMEGNSLTLTKQQLAMIQGLTDDLKPVVSPRLRKVIRQLEEDLNNKAVNKNFTVAALH